MIIYNFKSSYSETSLILGGSFIASHKVLYILNLVQMSFLSGLFSRYLMTFIVVVNKFQATLWEFYFGCPEVCNWGSSICSPGLSLRACECRHQLSPHSSSWRPTAFPVFGFLLYSLVFFLFLTFARLTDVSLSFLIFILYCFCFLRQDLTM